MGQGGGAAGRRQTSTKILEHLLSFPTALWPALRPARGRWRQIQPSAAQPLARTGAGGLRTVPRGSDSLGVYFSAVRQRQGRGEPRSDPARAAPESSLRGGLSGSLSPPAPWQPEHRPSWRNSLPRTLWLSCFPPPAFRSHQRGEAPGRDSRSWFLCVNTIAREISLFTRLFSLLYPHYAAPKRSRQVSASC